MKRSKQELQSLTINREALQCLPESVARDSLVLPIAFEGVRLRCVVSETLPAADQLKLEQRLQCVLDCPFQLDTADPVVLKDVIDCHYLAFTSRVTNCSRRFSFQCPRKWIEMQKTESPVERWCTTCGEIVTFCRTEEELDRLTAAKQCVAFINGNDFDVEDSILLGLLDSGSEQ